MYHQDYEFLHTVEGKREKSLDCLLAQRDLSEKKKWMSRSIDDEMKQEALENAIIISEVQILL